MNKKLAVQPLSENTRKAIIIAAIVLVAVIILSVSLALILRPVEKLPDDQNSGSSGSSSLTIRNGDFAYTSSEGTAYPKTAQNWTKYGYKAKSGSDTHDFESISTHENAVMGIINTSTDEDVEDNWNTVVSDLAEEGLNISNPSRPNDDAEDHNVYMIATREPTAASILSDSFSVTSGSSVKITVWLNTSQLTEGNAVIMIQKSTVSALSKYWYAYNFEVGKQDGWQQYTFHIFNRENSTQYLRISIGIGNVYSGEEYTKNGDLLFDEGEVIKGAGVLFIDEIEYEKVNADEYRQVVDAEYLNAEDYVEPTDKFQPYKILENIDITDDSIYLPLKAEEDGTTVTPLGYDEYLEEATYSPFTKKDDFVDVEGDVEEFRIYKISNTSKKGTIGLRLEAEQLNGIVSSLIRKDHHHISFWVRVDRVNKVARANVHVQFKEDPDGKWEDLSSGSWTAITTSQDLDTDSNAGWVKYDVYIKPSAVSTNVSILFTFGDEKENKLAANGSLYVTKPAYEKISYKDYNNASAGSYVKKFDLIGNSAKTSIANGSFSSLSNSGLQPSGWTAAFAGDNSIYRDGLGDEFNLDRTVNAVLGSGIANNKSLLPSINSGNLDDAQQKALMINNNVPTSYGYMSSDVSLSARTAYVISVLARTVDNLTGNPYIYLLDTDTNLERGDRVIAKIEDKDAQTLPDEAEKLFGQEFTTSELGNNWVRYYFIVVTGSSSRTVRLALFNGSLDGKTLEKGIVYYDQAEILSLGSYSFEKYEDPEEGSYEETHYNVVWTDHPYAESTDGFGENFGDLLVQNVEDSEDNLLESWGISVNQPSEEDWEEMRLIPEEKEEDPDDNKDTTTPSDVDLGLLFSVISSVALLAALLVVLVLRLFKEGKFKRKAA